MGLGQEGSTATATPLSRRAGQQPVFRRCLPHATQRSRRQCLSTGGRCAPRHRRARQSSLISHAWLLIRLACICPPPFSPRCISPCTDLYVCRSSLQLRPQDALVLEALVVACTCTCAHACGWHVRIHACGAQEHAHTPSHGGSMSKQQEGQRAFTRGRPGRGATRRDGGRMQGRAIGQLAESYHSYSTGSLHAGRRRRPAGGGGAPCIIGRGSGAMTTACSACGLKGLMRRPRAACATRPTTSSASTLQ